MTYCLGIRTKEGLVAISDTRISSGNNTTQRKKISIRRGNNYCFFFMTSGLRSVRDKAVHYFEDVTKDERSFTKMYKLANAFGECIKRVAEEDKQALLFGGYKFNLNTIIGGQLSEDDEHKLFLIYPEGNWIEIGHGTPYVVIGNTGHGKGILNRILTDDSTIEQALKAGFISFDSTRMVSNDVEFPIDIAVYEKNSFVMQEQHLYAGDLQHVSNSWNNALQRSVNELPNDWIKKILTQNNTIQQ